MDAPETIECQYVAGSAVRPYADSEYVVLATLQEVFLTSSHVAIIMELGDGGDLSRFTAAQCDPAVSAGSASGSVCKRRLGLTASWKALRQLAGTVHASVHRWTLISSPMTSLRRAEG